MVMWGFRFTMEKIKSGAIAFDFKYSDEFDDFLFESCEPPASVGGAKSALKKVINKKFSHDKNLMKCKGEFVLGKVYSYGWVSCKLAFSPINKKIEKGTNCSKKIFLVKAKYVNEKKFLIEVGCEKKNI